MIWLLLLQVSMPSEAEFARYVEQARRKLDIAPVRVVVSDAQPWASWVPYGPGAGWLIYVRPDFLRDAPPQTKRVVATHECCHLYIGNNRRPIRAWEVELQHAMIDGCVAWVLGPDLDATMRLMPCNDWYPDEASRYNRLHYGKERCIEKRSPYR